MNNILRCCLVLFIISSVCVVALAYVNEITTEPIRKQQELEENAAYKVLFPQANEFRQDEKTPPEGSIITGITTAYNNGAVLGDVIKMTQKGYGGGINMMVGIGADGSVTSVKVISHSETPGLGANIDQGWFAKKFEGKSQFPLSVIKSGVPGDNEVDAITSATISTKAVTDAVNTAYEWAVKEGGLK